MAKRKPRRKPTTAPDANTKRRRTEEALGSAFAESGQRAEEASALLESARAVLERRRFEDAARAIFDSCKNLIGATAGYVALLSKDGTENEVLFLDSGEKPCAVDPSLPMPIRGLRGEAYRTGKAEYDNDFSSSRWEKFMPQGHVSLDNVLFAPLVIEGRVVGLLGVANKPGGFSENDARMASAFGELASVALLNSRTLESLESSEERFRSVAETASDAIICVDSQGAITLWNNAASTVFGYSADEVLGGPLTCIIPERFREAHLSGMERVALTGQSGLAGKRVEVVGLRKGGSEIPVELSVASWRTAEGVFFTGIVRDITERKRAEEALRESEERYRCTLDGLLEGCQIIGFDWRYLYVNEAVAVHGRRAKGELLGHTMMEIYPGIDETEMFGFLRRCMEERIPHRMENEFTYPDGAKAWFELSMQPMSEGVLILSWDITKRKRMEEALQRAREELEGKVERQMVRKNPYGLTFREFTVLHHVAAGRADKEIAGELGISPLTVHKHVSNILGKMNAASRTEAGTRALREGLLD